MGCSSSACAYCGKDLYDYSWECAKKHVDRCTSKLTENDKGDDNA